MNPKTLRLAIALIAVGLMVPSAAFAQRYLDTPGYDGEGMPYRDCSADETFEEEIEEDVSDSPAELREATDETAELSAEERLALAEQERSLQEEQIRQLQELLDEMPSDYPNRADVLFRLAEAYRQLADADYLVAREDFNGCINNWYSCASDTPCYEPLPDYTGSIDRYRDVVRNHPSYERTDEVIFRLGETLMENDEAAEGVTFLSNLVSNYGDSGYVCDALVMMADHYFDNDLLIAARQNYEDALQFTTCALYNYSVYKLAWVDINEDLFETALSRLQEVVTNIDNAVDQRIDFRNQALNDMLLAYVEIDDGWILARDYYQSHEGEDVMRRKLGMLSDLYDEQGKDSERVALLDWFIGTYPMDSQVPQWADQMLVSMTNIGDWNAYEAQARDFIDYLDHRPGSQWWTANEGEQGAHSNARMLTENTLLHIINRNFTEAERLTNDPDTAHALYLEVAEDYEQFFERFPDSSEAYDQAFFYAEVLYYQLADGGDCGEDHWLSRGECDGFLQRAGEQYMNVVEMRPDPEADHTEDSAIGALQVFDDFMIREVPDIDDPLPPPDQFCDVYDCDTEVELSESQTDYVDIVAWFADIYPEHELIPAASWRAAALFLRNGHIAEAAERFETIIEHHPSHRFAQEAALAAFVCYNYVEDWVNIESVARRLLEVCDDGDSDICQRDRLERAIAYAMNNQAEDLMEAGRQFEIDGDDSGAQEMFLQAADTRVSLYEEFPDSEWSPTALFNAAATYERARAIDRSIELYNEYLTVYTEEWFTAQAAEQEEDAAPIVNLRADATYTLGLIHDSQANFEEAVTWFEAVDAYTDFDNRAMASYNAGRLREAMGQLDEAIARYEHFIELDPDSTESEQVMFIIVGVLREQQRFDEAVARLQTFLDANPDAQVARLVAVHQQAEIRTEQGNDEAAMTLYQEVYNMFGVGELGIGEDGLPTGWVVEPGGNFDPDERAQVLPFAAQSRFIIADVEFMTTRNLSLAFEPGEWEQLTENLIARGESLEGTQASLFEVVNFGDAEWAVAASVRIGQLYHDFYRDIYDLPPPDYDECLDMGGSYDDCDQLMDAYDEALYTIAEPLEQKASDAYAEARRIAIENNVFTEWTLLTNEELNDIDRSFQVGGAEGLSPTNTQDSYIATAYILSLDDKLEAFEDFVEPMPGLDMSDPGLDPTGTPNEGMPTEGADDMAPEGGQTEGAGETVPTSDTEDETPTEGESTDGAEPTDGEEVEK